MDFNFPPLTEYHLKAERFCVQAALDHTREVLSPGNPLDVRLEMIRDVADQIILSFQMLAWGREVCVEQGPTRTAEDLKTSGPFWIPRTLRDKVLAAGVDVLRAMNAVILRRIDHRAAKVAAKALRRWRWRNVRFALRYSHVAFVKTSTVDVHHKHFCPHVTDGRRDTHIAFVTSGTPWHGSVDQYEALKKVAAACLDARKQYLETPREYRRLVGELPFSVDQALRKYENEEKRHKNYGYAKFLGAGRYQYYE